jgi:hypothetical protein
MGSFQATIEKSVFSVGHALPHRAPCQVTAVNMHPQQWETVFCMGSVKRNYLAKINGATIQF